jgi:hypothetical protein
MMLPLGVACGQNEIPQLGALQNRDRLGSCWTNPTLVFLDLAHRHVPARLSARIRTIVTGRERLEEITNKQASTGNGP